MSQRTRIAFRTAGAASTAPRIDREAGIIRGASAMQAVEALGHGCIADATTLRQVVELGNAAAKGIKARFTHPGLCADGMGTLLGRMRNFRIEGDKAVGDLHLAESSAKSPDGNLREYVLDLAEEDPAAFGMSVVIGLHRVWKLADGSEIRTDDPSLRRGSGEDAYFERPATATTELPLIRVDSLHAADVVDEPAANRDGMFAAFGGTTSLDAAAAFTALDQVRERLGLSADDLRAFLSRYLTTRGLAAANPKDHPMKIDIKRLSELSEKNPAHAVLIAKLAAGDHDEAAILAAIGKAEGEARLAALTSEIESLKAGAEKAKAEHATALKAEADKAAAAQSQLAALQSKYDALSKLGKGASADPGGASTPTGAETDPLAEPNLKKRWEIDEKLRQAFGGEFPALVALARDEKAAARQALGL